LGLLAMSLVYLVFDFFPQVSSVRAILLTPAFWILWVVFSFLDLLAFSLVYQRSFQHVNALIPARGLAIAAVQFLATIGVYSILQSFTIQFAGQKVIDVQQLVSRFRAKALEASVAKNAMLARQYARWIAGGLREIYKADTQALTEDYSQIMSLAGLSNDRINTQLGSYINSVDLERDTLLTELVMRIAVTDKESALRLLSKRKRQAKHN